MACKIIRNSVSNNIERVLADNGKDSILFEELINHSQVNNSEQAVLAWAHTRTDFFKEEFKNYQLLKDTNNEPAAIRMLASSDKFYVGLKPDHIKVVPLFDKKPGAKSESIVELNRDEGLLKVADANVISSTNLNYFLAYLADSSTSLNTRYLAKKMLDSMESKSLNIPVNVTNIYSDFNVDGFYEPSRGVMYINDNSSKLEEVILHEGLHALLHFELDTNAQFNEEMTKILEDVRKHYKGTEVENIHELVSYGLTNAEFQDVLKSIPFKGTTVWERLKLFILDLLGIPYNTVADKLAETVMKKLNNNDYEFGLMQKAPLFKKTERTYSVDKLHESELVRDSVTNKYTRSGKVYKSVTGDMIPSMQNREPNIEGLTYGQRKADAIWGPEDKKVLKKVKDFDKMVDYATYAAYMDNVHDLAIAKGQIFHKLIHYHFTKDESIKKEISAIMATYDISDGEIEWIDSQTILKVIYRTGTDYVRATFDEGDMKIVVNPKSTDKVFTEITISSDILKLAGTVDLILDHGDNVVSFFDVKSGAAFDRLFENDIFSYGIGPSEDLFVNPRNKAKMQLMWYALIAKIKDPNLRFRNLELIHIPNYSSITKLDSRSKINVKNYLYSIENFLKEKQPDVYAELQKLEHFNQLFDPATYNAHDINSVNLDTEDDLAKSLQMKMLRLQSLVLWDKSLEEGLTKGYKKNRATYEEITKLMKEIIALKGDPEINYASWTTDMSWMDQYFGSGSYSTHPYVQLYYKILQENKKEANDKYHEWRRKFDSLTKQLMKEAGMPDWQLGIGSLVGGVSKDKLFSFAFKTYEVGGVTKTRYITEKDSEWNAIKGTTRETFMRFVLDSVDQFFVDSKSNYINPKTGKKEALANRVATQRKVRGKLTNITNLDLARGSGRVSSDLFEETGGNYVRGWMPKYPPTYADVLREHPWYSATSLKYLWNRYMTNYFEGFYDGWFNTEEAIPMKYLGGGIIDREQNFTFDLELGLDNFVKQYYYKESLDSVYAFANGLKLYLKSLEEGGVQFDALKKWFDISINMHILGHKSTDVNLTRRGIRREDIDRFRTFNTVKFLRSLKTFFAGPTMWLKPLSGTSNFVFAYLVSLKEGAKNMIGDNPNTRFTVSHLREGFTEARKLVLADGLTGKTSENKAMNLMQKFRYLPDNYDWFTTPNQLMTARNQLFTSKTLYAFHTLPEEMIATAIFVAQLKAMKTPDGKSVWDHYVPVTKTDANGVTYTSYEWDGTVRGKVNTSNVSGVPNIQDLTDLTIDEIDSVKFTYEKIHGGYRLDERPYIEYFIWGELMMQFKKYLPSILKNIGASRGESRTRGYFKEITRDGVTYKQWTPDVIEGRWRLVIGQLLNFLAIKSTKLTNGKPGNRFLEWLNLQNSETYRWDNLSEAQKEDLRDFYITTLTWILMSIGYMLLWDRKEESGLKKLYGRITNDFAGNVQPLEVLKNIVNLSKPVAVNKAYKMADSFTEVFWSSALYTAGYEESALTKQGYLRGWKEFERNIHFLASYHDLVKFFSESEEIDGPDFLEQKLK